jgi:hypothetical protein
VGFARDKDALGKLQHGKFSNANVFRNYLRLLLPINGKHQNCSRPSAQQQNIGFPDKQSALDVGDSVQ